MTILCNLDLLIVSALMVLELRSFRSDLVFNVCMLKLVEFSYIYFTIEKVYINFPFYPSNKMRLM